MKKTGLVFSGGGAKGAYQIGVWRALEEFGVADRISNVDYDGVGNKVKHKSRSFFGALGNVVMFFFTIFAKFIGIILIIVAFFRELLGSGTLFDIQVIPQGLTTLVM